LGLSRLLLGAKANVNHQDCYGQTPLHVAAMHDEAALVAILIEEGADMALPDYQGDNAMHVAIKAEGERILNSQGQQVGGGAVDAIKVMIGQGANIESPDSQGQNPIGIAEAQRKMDIALYLRQRLRGVRDDDRTVTSQLSDAIYAIGFWFMFCIFHGLFYMLLMPQLPVVGLYQAVYYTLTLVAAVSHIVSWQTDPGYLNSCKENVEAFTKQQAKDDFRTGSLHDQSKGCTKEGGLRGTLSEGEYLQLTDGEQGGEVPTGVAVVRKCPTCEVLKPRRSKHCTICRLCVDRFDHHCPWINNCVGRANHRVFMVFITSLMVILLYMAFCCLFATIDDERGALPFVAIPFLPSEYAENATTVSEPFLVQYLHCDQDPAKPCSLHRWLVCSLGVMLLIMGVRVGCLWWEQVVRVAQNITTYEQNSPWRFPYISHTNDINPQLVNDFDRGGCGGNCRDFWNCGGCEGPSMGLELDVTYSLYCIYGSEQYEQHYEQGTPEHSLWHHSNSYIEASQTDNSQADVERGLQNTAGHGYVEWRQGQPESARR